MPPIDWHWQTATSLLEQQAMIRILVVEDDNQHLRLMAWVLGEEGFDVTTASSTDAAARAREVQPGVIVFNTGEDASVKGACIQKLRRSSPAARIIDVGPESESPAHNSGADAYLDMPVTAAELKAAIQGLLTP